MIDEPAGSQRRAAACHACDRAPTRPPCYRNGHRPAASARKPERWKPDGSARRTGRAGLLEPGVNSHEVRHPRSSRTCSACCHASTAAGRSPGGPAGFAGLGQHAGQHRAGQRVLQLADQNQGLPVTADRLAWLAEPGVHESRRVPRHGQRGCRARPGDGSGLTSHSEIQWRDPSYRRFVRSLSSFCRAPLLCRAAAR